MLSPLCPSWLLRAFRVNRLLLALTVLITLNAAAQLAPTDAHGHPWWQHAVFYEIYPRSFADSNNDGIGDLNGITAHLDYLQKLGVDAIWITPCYPSPQVDFGYDVSDYRSIDPQYGTLADFDRLAAEAQKRGIRIVMDYVLNHTSDQHPWFLDSRSSRTAEHRDWYVWHEGKGGAPPNNWQSLFGGPAWEFDQETGQFYLHQFYVQQPDLNWNNPAVKQAMFDVARFWYERGVAGFRLDAVDRLFEDPQFRDNPVKTLPDGSTEIEDVYTREQPGEHRVLRELRQVSDAYHAVLIGETWTDDIAGLLKYYGNGQELQLPMDFNFATVNKLSASEFRKQIGFVESACDQTTNRDSPFAVSHSQEASGQQPMANGEGRPASQPSCIAWPVFLLSNHDMERGYNRYGDGKNNDQIAKMMSALLLTLRGTPLLYYGEEIGMENNDPTRVEDVKDPVGRREWPRNKGRDGERTPMQWDSSLNAGFSQTAPWLPVPPSFKTHNVRSEEKKKDSVLGFYRDLLKLRHDNPALEEGNYVVLNPEDPNVLSFLREEGGRAVLVALNMTATPQTATFSLLSYSPRMKELLASGASGKYFDNVRLQPYGVFIAELRAKKKQ